VNTRTQEASFAYVRSFTFRKFNPFVEAGAGMLIFLPIRNTGTTTLNAQQQIPDYCPVRRRHRLRDQPQL
jgi:outer membrane immunogenic protein